MRKTTICKARSVALLLLFLTGTTHLSAVNLLKDGGFEFGVQPGNFTTPATLGGWSLVIRTGAERVGVAGLPNDQEIGAPPLEGTNAIFLVGRIGISQTFSTAIGQHYQVSLSANGLKSAPGKLFITAFNSSPDRGGDDLSAALTSVGGGVWTKKEFTFTATGSKTTLEILGDLKDSVVLIDDVSVIMPIPEVAVFGAGERKLSTNEVTGGLLKNVRRSANPINFNNRIQQPLSYSFVSSGTITIDANNDPDRIYRDTNNRDDIAAVTLMAETVVIRSPWRLKATHVKIYARELRIEGAGQVFTTGSEQFPIPVDATAEKPGSDGLPGANAGDMEVYVEKYTDASGNDETKFWLVGGSGGPAGKGKAGTDGFSLPEYYKRVFLDVANSCDPTLEYIAPPPYQVSWYRTAQFDDILGPFAPPTLRTVVGQDGWPGDGTDALPAGKPGKGGNAGFFTCNASVADSIRALGVSVASGKPGAPGLPPDGSNVWKGGKGGEPRFAQQITTDWNLFNPCAPATLTAQHESKDGADSKEVERAEHGETGRVGDIPNPYTWVNPQLLRKILNDIQDDYLQNRVSRARTRLQEYVRVIKGYQADQTFWNPANLTLEQLELAQIRDEMTLLLQQLANGLDYFGNPAGWVPMLSFEALGNLFDKEIDRSLDIVYLARWIRNKSEDADGALLAMDTARGKLAAEVAEAKGQYATAKENLDGLTFEAEELRKKLENVRLKLEAKDAQLHDKAVANSQPPAWETALRASLKIVGIGAKMIPAYQPALGAVGDGLNLASDFNPDEPWETVKGIPDIATTYLNAKAEERTAEHEAALAANDMDPATLAARDAHDKRVGKLQNLSNASSQLSDGMRSISDFMQSRRVPSDKLEAELEKLRNADPEYGSLVTEVEQLVQANQDFADNIVAALQDTVGLSDLITRNLLAMEALSTNNSAFLNVLDDRASAYLNDMERRAWDRLLKYHYYMAKAFEYRLVQPYTAQLNLKTLYDKISAIATNSSASSAGVLPDQQKDPDIKESLHSLFRDLLAKTSESILENFISSRPSDGDSFNYDFNASELAALNRGETLTLNLYERGFFNPEDEDIRIRNISFLNASRISVVTNIPPNQLLSPTSVELHIEHSGLSNIKKDGQVYQFRHYSDDTRTAITWKPDFDPSDASLGTDSDRAPKPSADSLLRQITDLKDDELLLYSTPSAWADLKIWREVRNGRFRTGRGQTNAPFTITRATLLVEWDYAPRANTPKRTNLEVLAAQTTVEETGILIVDEKNALTPDLKVSVADINGRQDAQGRFLRIYNSGRPPTVTVTAPRQFGYFQFWKWTEDDAEVPNSTASVTVPTTDDHLLVALYVPVASPSNTFVNKVPVFTKGPDQTINENSGPQAVTGWATTIQPGPPEESAQKVSFIVLSDNAALFSTPPAIDPNGTLSYTPAPNANGSTTVTVRLHDDGGTANGGVDTSADQTFSITVQAVTTAPILVNNILDAGPGSLRQALADAAARPGSDTISFGGDFSTPINLQSEIVIDDSDGVVIDASDLGPGVTVSGQKAHRLFHIKPGASATFQHLILSNGSVAGGFPEGYGGALFIEGALTLSECTLSGNSAFAGGGAFVSASTTSGLILLRCAVVGNSADFGGGVQNEGALTSIYSTFALNSAVTEGGAISTPSSAITLTHTTISSNTSAGRGGAVAASGEITIRNSIVAGNEAPTDPNIAGAIIALGANLTEGDPLLAALDNNGGPTDTMALLEGSPARDAAVSGLLDQRGAPIFNTPDLGAFEAQFGPLPDIVMLEDQPTVINIIRPNTSTVNVSSSGGVPLQAVLSAPDLIRTLTLTPSAEVNGVTTIQLVDSVSGESAFFQVSVTPVNDPPTFTKGPDQNANSDAGAQTVSNWATAISAGPANEASQALTFGLTNSSPALFSVGPAVSPTGTLTYTPAPGVRGTAIVTVLLQDNGGTDNGGVDVSEPRTFTITLNTDALPPLTVINAQDSGPGSLRQALAGAAARSGPDTIVFGGDFSAPINLESEIVIDDADGVIIDASDLNRGVTVSGKKAHRLFHFKQGTVASFLRLNITDGTVTGGFPEGYGAGLFIEGAVTLIDCTLSGNSAYAGGGAFVSANGASSLTLRRCTVQGNTADFGGGIQNEGTLVSDHSTFSLNSAKVEGGAISTPPSSVTLIHTTISGNTAATRGGGVAGDQIAIQNSIIAGNTAEAGPNVSGGFIGTGVNLTDRDPLLAPLDNHGGITKTMALLGGSPALNAAEPGLSTVDQRGQSIFGLPDIGAFESQFSVIPEVVVLEDHSIEVPIATSHQDAILLNSSGALPLQTVFSEPSTNRTLTITPAADANGAATITMFDISGDVTSFQLAVSPVNDAPRFTKGPDQTASAAGGPQTVANWATAISAGPTNEVNQVLNFIVSNDRPAFFSVPPAISPSGALTYTLAAGASGSANMTVQLNDNGGTDNGGEDTSPAQTFVIAVPSLVPNQAPSFVKGADQSVNSDQGPQVVAGWATAISPGPASESAQALAFLVSNDNDALFTAPPAIAPNGTLLYTPAPDFNGTANVTVQLKDNGGTANGGVDTSAAQTFTITVVAPSVVFLIVTTTADSGAGSLRQALIDAAAQAGADTITFAPGFEGPIALESEIVIDDAGGVTIDAANIPIGVNVSGRDAHRVFHIKPETTAAFKRLTITDGLVTGGFPDGYGGGLYIDGALTLTECTLSGNSAFAGGAAFVSTSAGARLTLDRCTVSGNSAGFGGGIQNEGTLVSTSSTLALNTATEEGGAISSTSTTLTLTQTTVAGNTANTRGGGIAGGQIAIQHSIVAGNTASTDPNLSGAVTATGVNLAGGDPLLAPLGANGGPTETMALLPGSPALNAATGSNATTDQRGLPIVGVADLGAFEAQPASSSTPPRLAIRQSGTNLMIAWDSAAGIVLERTDVLTPAASWTPVPFITSGNTSSASVNVEITGSSFFRLRQP